MANGLIIKRMPQHHPGLVVQPRDRQVLAEVGRYNVLTSEHLKHLVFAAVSQRLTNRRIAQLVEVGLLARHHVPDIEGGSIVRSRRPLYSLTRRGAELVEGGGVRALFRFSPSTWPTVRHNLVATDLLVSVAAAGRGRGLVVETLPEAALRLRLAASRGAGNQFPGAVLPDGVFSIGAPGGEAVSFCIEVVRSGAKGGNRNLRLKMERYVALNHVGFFRAVYGLGHLRAMLIVTTSASRARRLAELAQGLTHGRNLFWATGYEGRPGLAMTFDPATVLGLPFVDRSGAEHVVDPAV